MHRTGLGFDSHRLSAGRKLVLGGLEIPAPFGEEAHSDGDVLLHAFCDALYGAIGAGDIGEHFPDTDPKWRGQASVLFLRHALGAVRDAGYRLVNADCTVFLEQVKLSPHKRRIEENLLGIVREFQDIPEDAVNVKAKTGERCDAVGRGELIAAQVAVLIQRAVRGP